MAMDTRLRGWKLQKLRREVLLRQPLCVDCLKVGVICIAVEVDHIVPLHKQGTNDVDNLQGLCSEHHRKKTAADMNTTYRPPVGLDGWPFE